MPKTEIKVRSGKKYPASYRVVGSLADLTEAQKENILKRALRTSARANVLGTLQGIEPAILANKAMREKMLAAFGNEEMVDAFMKSQEMYLDIPSEFDVPIAKLIPDGDPVDPFTFGESDEDEEGGATSEAPTAE